MPELVARDELLRRRSRGATLIKQPAERGGMAVLSTFNLDLLPPFAAESLERHGVPATLRFAGFGQLAREVADPGSELYTQEPEAVLLVPTPEDLLEPLFTGGVGPDADALVEERVQELADQVDTVLERLPATTVFVVCFGTGRVPDEHVLDPAARRRGQEFLQRFDASVRALGERSPRVVVVDFDWAVRRVGRHALGDERLWYLGRMRLNPQGLALLADLVAGHVAASRGVGRRKVAVVDLDDTLWGGVVGEAGVSGLALGDDGIGLAFTDFQRELRKLQDAGVVLAMCSKNNPDDVDEAFTHPGMVLTREHFAAERVNWQDKVTNITEIAGELNVGLDALVFFDDNPVERDWVRQALPEVCVPELPEDPAYRPAFLAGGAWFQTLAVTADDRLRAESYRAQGVRRRIQGGAQSFEGFLTSLEQEVKLEAVNEASLARTAQLCQKTNQFNLTSIRHTAAAVEAMMNNESFDLYTVAVSDRYGDSGITGVAILMFEADESRVETLLLSCRVLGRRIEDALIAFLARRSKARGARGLSGSFEPTARNAQVADFYPTRNFVETAERTWRLDLQGDLPGSPPEIAVVEAAHA